MSDTDNAKGKSKVNSWSEHEVLVYLLSAIEYSGTKIDFANAPCPAGRNASGCTQKMGKIKRALQPEIDAIKNGESLAEPVDTAPKKTGGRKRKTPTTDDDGEGTHKRRGRPKKNAIRKKDESTTKEENESTIKDEPEDDLGLSAEMEV